MANLKLNNINKIYEGENQAVFDFNLDINDKEFIVFVGPSGCGKSTTLRMIAGLEEISTGEISIDGEIVNEVAPKDRDIAMVFQSYALYSHMTVYDNMAFGLKLKKVPKDEIDKKIRNAAEILELTDYLDRKPKALSGGQRQRVALGRAIVRNPKVFLMDEPLSNLDAKLRVAMRTEIIKLHKSLEATTIYVTHDQTEAMTMADRIVVMKDGYIQQIGTPKEIYDHPNNIFVGGFTGAPAMNFLKGQLQGNKFIIGDTFLEIPEGKLAYIKDDYNNKEIVLGVRPEDIHKEAIFTDVYKNASLKIKVEAHELLGHETNIYSNFEGQKIVAKVNARTDCEVDSELDLVIDMNKIHFFDPETELNLISNNS